MIGGSVRTYKVTDEVAVGLPGCSDDLGSGGIRFSIRNVFCDGAGEEYRLLTYYADFAS